MARTFALALVLSLLAGCANQSLTGDAPDSTTAGSGTGGAEKGLVIVGFVYTGEPFGPLKTCPLGRASPLFLARYNLVFSELDANNQTSWFKRALASDGACEFRNSAPAARYSFVSVNPGRHVLGGIVSDGGRTRVAFSNPPVISVAAGEVVYIGDVMFAAEIHFGDSITNARFSVALTANDARAALAARNLPADRMVVRPLEIVSRPTYQ